MCLQWQIFRRRPLTLSLALDWVLKLLLSTGKLSRPRVYSSQNPALGPAEGVVGVAGVSHRPGGRAPGFARSKGGHGGGRLSPGGGIDLVPRSLAPYRGPCRRFAKIGRTGAAVLHTRPVLHRLRTLLQCGHNIVKMDILCNC